MLPRVASVAARERLVLYEHPDKETVFPGRNDVPMPERYQQAGYTRVEYPNISDIRRVEKRENVTSEIGSFDGSGHADSD